MTTQSTTQPNTQSARVPLRLRMSARAGHDRLDGAWWPQSRDLAVELADLVDHFPTASGRITRVVFSPPDWDEAPVRQVTVAAGTVKIGSFPRDDTHLMQVKTSDHALLHLLVVPPGTPQAPAEAALLAAAAQGNAAGAEHLLATAAASQREASDTEEHWQDDGGH